MKALKYLRKIDAPVRYNPNSIIDFLTNDDWEYLGKDVAVYVSVFMKHSSLGEMKLMNIVPGPEQDQTTFLMEIPDPKTKEGVVVGFTIERVSEEPARWELKNAAELSEFSAGNYMDLLKTGVEGWLRRSGVAFSVFWENENGDKDALAGYAFDGSHASEKAEHYLKGREQLGKTIMSHHPTIPAAIVFAYCLNKRNGKNTRWDQSNSSG
jgi:hypothetical protein